MVIFIVLKKGFVDCWLDGLMVDLELGLFWFKLG
jgi:hypothetical protein